jgi:hypothetical protein
MKTQCDNIRFVDQFNISIKLTKQDLADLISVGKLKDIIYAQDKQISIELELNEKANN